MKNQSQPDYRIYATLLDAYEWYRVSESELAAQELIDKINRVPVTDPTAISRMNRGSALNQLVDIAVDCGEVLDSIIIDGEQYSFPEGLVESLAAMLYGSVSQYQCTMGMIVKDGKFVELYGYLDYLLTDKVIDLKTTSSYDIGKYKNSMQRHLYPCCLISDDIEVSRFEFLAVEIKSGGCNVFSEEYPVIYSNSMAIIRESVNGFVEFLDAKRDLITDEKIFGQLITEI